MTGHQRNESCQRCGACCTHIAVCLPDIMSDENAEFRKWASRRGKIEGKFWIIKSRCPYLADVVLPGGKIGGTCTVYPNRPKPCRDYPMPGDWLPSGCAYGKI